MKEIYFLFAIISNIIPAIHTLPIISQVSNAFGRTASQAGKSLKRTISFKAVQGKYPLQRSLSQPSLVKKPQLRPSVQRSLSESSILQPINGGVRSASFVNYACQKGKLLIAKNLIEKLGIVPDLNTLNSAAYSGNLDLVKYLIENHGLEPDRSTLLYASKYGKNLDLVSYLVKIHYLIPEKTVLDATSPKSAIYKFLYKTHLNYAFESTLINQLQNIVGEAVESSFEYYRSHRNLKLLAAAIDNDDFDQVKKLVHENRLVPNFPMLDSAANLGNSAIFDFLISQ